MKKILKSSLSLAMAALMSLSMFAHAGEAVADDHASSVSYNIGYMSDYWYRGAYQSDSSVSFGADAEMGNFYVGTWMADVDSGIEYDFYAGYNFEMMGVPMYLGATGYYYSDNFDGDYEEFNTGADLGFIAIDAAFDGEFTAQAKDGGGKTGYQHYTITVPGLMIGLPFDYSYQTFTGGSTGSTHELSYGASVSGIDVGLTVGRNSDDSAGPEAKYIDTTYATFSLGYSF